MIKIWKSDRRPWLGVHPLFEVIDERGARFMTQTEIDKYRPKTPRLIFMRVRS